MKEKGRLRPGNIFFVDLKNGRVLPDKEMKEEIVGKRRYRRWLEREKLTLADFVEEHKLKVRDQAERAVCALKGESRRSQKAAFPKKTDVESMLSWPQTGSS